MRTAITCLFAVAIFHGEILADEGTLESVEKNWNAGLKVGFLIPGEFFTVQGLQGKPFSTTLGVQCELGLDWRLGSYFSLGMFGMFMYTENPDDAFSYDLGTIPYLAFGVRFKGRSSLSQNLELRPCFSLGWGMFLEGDGFTGNLSDSSGVMIGFAFEFVYSLGSDLGLIVDAGVFLHYGSVMERNVVEDPETGDVYVYTEDYSIIWAPIFSTTLGVEYSW